jgi:hypothetical protein
VPNHQRSAILNGLEKERGGGAEVKRGSKGKRRKYRCFKVIDAIFAFQVVKI